MVHFHIEESIADISKLSIFKTASHCSAI